MKEGRKGLLILDKDGPLVKPLSGETFVQDPSDPVVLDGVRKKLEDAEKAGFAIAIASNQGGVAAGYKSLSDAEREMIYCLDLLPVKKAIGLMCPDKGETVCLFRKNFRGTSRCHSGEPFFGETRFGSFRKPGPGMLRWIVEYHYNDGEGWESNLDEQMLLFVGDREEDKQAAQAAKIPFSWADQWRLG